MTRISSLIVTLLFGSAMVLTGAPSVQAHIIEEDTSIPEMPANKPTARLSVNGQGISFQEPDTAHVSAGVVSTGITAEDAMKENGVKMAAAIEALLAAGVKRKHIQTSGLNLQPVYNHNGPVYSSNGIVPNAEPRKIISYSVNNMVTAKTHDLDKLGLVFDSLVKAGINNIAGIRFSLKDDSVAKAESRKEAIKDARTKAKIMAEGAGVKLGRILVMGEGANYNTSYSDQIVMTGVSSGGAFTSGTVVQSGQQQITASVNMIFEIIQ